MLAAAIVGALAAGIMLPRTSGAQRSELQMLGHLGEGRWELRFRDGGGVTTLCIGADRRRLIQIRHPDLACSRLVVEDAPRTVTVQYICRGHGYGRTRIREESRNLVQIDTQGIADGLPFDLSAEGRRVGDCVN